MTYLYLTHGLTLEISKTLIKSLIIWFFRFTENVYGAYQMKSLRKQYSLYTETTIVPQFSRERGLYMGKQKQELTNTPQLIDIKKT